MIKKEVKEDIKPSIYIVKKGDDLKKIANKFDTTVCKLIEINDLKIPNLVYPGQVIVIE